MKGLVDYLKGIEDRIKNLESDTRNVADTTNLPDKNSGKVKGIEGQIEKLKTDIPDTNLPEKNSEKNPDQRDYQDDPKIFGVDSEANKVPIDISVKFFDARSYMDRRGWYMKVQKDQTKAGTFMCGHDRQHLIRVLYHKVPPDGAKPQEGPDPEPPNPNNIEVITFGVFSDAISAFLEKHHFKDLEATHSRMIGFGKPFRSFMRILHPIRRQLEKLERIYG